MEKARVFMIIQSALCILTVVLLCGAAIGIYSEGKARRAEDPTAYIYTRETAASAAAPGAFVLVTGLGFSIAGWVLGIYDENADKPVKGDSIDADGMKRLLNAKTSEDVQDHDKSDRLKKIRFAVLIIAVICIIAGIANGNMHAVLVKAINICTECIGLG